MATTFEFVGFPSGDGESFCWDVDEETFTSLTGETPTRRDKAVQAGLYRLYPDHLMPGYERLRFRVTMEEVPDPLPPAPPP